MPGSFLDSNIIIYSVSTDSKADIAEALVRAGGTISVQVLNEVARVVRGKLGYGWNDVFDLLAALRDQMDVVPLTIDTHKQGILLSARYDFSIFDGQIVAAAIESGCDTLWSEDMHNGLIVESRLTIRNPFASHPSH